MSSLADDIRASIKSVSGDWKKAKKVSDRNDRVSRARMSYMRAPRSHEMTLKEAAFKFMQAAYNKASTNGRYYANARQLMYAARPMIIGEIGDKWNNDSSPKYFQELVKDYIEQRDSSLKVVWDARGHLKEPHTEYEIGLGGEEVMKYQKDQTKGNVEEMETIKYKRVATVGPTHRYGAVLFVEKEGFDIALEDAGLAEKWDIAIMSSKGIPNGATCNVGAMVGVPVLALHDFDLDGFKIVKTLREGARLSRGVYNLIDIGLRMEDVTGLESEPVYYKQRNPKRYLQSCGATEEECNFLTDGHGSGQRVELNMLTTEQLIEFLERKFTEHGIKKVVPDEDTLRKAYRRAVFYREVIKRAEEIKQDDLSVPDDLSQEINDRLAEDPSQSWDDAIWDLVEEGS